jgi:hypothetical protein
MSVVKDVVMTASHERILASLLRYHFLLARQLCRLYYAPSSLHKVQELLKGLYDQGLVDRKYLSRAPLMFGRSAAVYFLTRKGLNALGELGYDTDFRFRPSEDRSHDDPFLKHSLGVNDFLIAAELFSRAHPELLLDEVRYERELKQEPVRVKVRTNGHEENIAVIPDAWLNFILHNKTQTCIALEFDRGTTERKAFQRAIRARLAWADGPYKKHFGTKSLTIAYLISGGPNRLVQVKRWIETELEGAPFHDFLLTDLDPALTDPEQLFSGPVWISPGTNLRHALLEGLSP